MFDLMLQFISVVSVLIQIYVFTDPRLEYVFRGEPIPQKYLTRKFMGVRLPDHLTHHQI